MSHNPRQLQLLAHLKEHGSASVEELAATLGVTLQTVRRDIQKLADAALLTRFHGGARCPGSTTENLAHQQRQALHADGKERIARRIAADIPNDCSLILNIGTTIEAVAHALQQHTGLRVITNNLHVANILSANQACEVIVTGGVVRPRDRGIVGEATVDFVRQFRVDIAVIGISGIESDGTLRDYDFREVKVAQSIMNQAREVWLAADASKFNRPAMVEVGHLHQLDRLYTDQLPSAAFTSLLSEADVELIVAS